MNTLMWFPPTVEHYIPTKTKPCKHELLLIGFVGFALYYKTGCETTGETFEVMMMDPDYKDLPD